MSNDYHKVVTQKSDLWQKDFDSYFIPLPPSVKDAKSLAKALDFLPKNIASQALDFAAKIEFTPKSGEYFAFDLHANLRMVCGSLPEDNTFSTLILARRFFERLEDSKSQKILFCVAHLDSELSAKVADCFLSAGIYMTHQGPKYGENSKKAEWRPHLTIACADTQVASLAKRMVVCAAAARATNLVRLLGERACNDLDCKNYVSTARDLAKKSRLDFKFFSFEHLKKMGAGAFCAVAQGSNHRDAGIAKLSYLPKGKKSKASLALVGKGVTYDTGGVNVKIGTHMYGMHSDMTGSAVALAGVILAAELELDFPVTAYLAIVDNAISNHAYRPNEVVKSLSGKAIEIVHTDAEGRMILADTLTLAAKDKPSFIVDYATLTGACVRAIGNAYSGVFTNRTSLNQMLIEFGEQSGERVWPFPMDKDFGECLKSDVADVKQCRLTGGVDHIEAAIFLSRFFDQSIPWVHVDLSAVQNDEGLGGVPTKLTGFGMRFTLQLMESLNSVLQRLDTKE